MRCRTRGQSLVEMAFVAPVLILILFGIIDISWYIFGYATVYQAARNAAEVAASLPPDISQISDGTSTPNAGNQCVDAILKAAGRGAVMFPDLQTAPGNAQFIRISYPLKNDDGSPKRVRGSSIEVSITYDFQSLTPLWNFISFGNQGKMHVETTARRTIENLGQNPNAVKGVVCQPD